jgi:hypothetical protein
LFDQMCEQDRQLEEVAHFAWGDPDALEDPDLLGVCSGCVQVDCVCGDATRGLLCGVGGGKKWLV